MNDKKGELIVIWRLDAKVHNSLVEMIVKMKNNNKNSQLTNQQSQQQNI